MNSLTQTTRGQVNELAIECYAQRELELEARIDELERELRWACDGNRAAVAMIRDLTLSLDRSREINRRLRTELAKLRDALVELEDRRAA